MAVTTLIVHSNYSCFNEKNLKSAISFEAERGYPDALGRNMRFSIFLHSKLIPLCFRSNHKCANKLLAEATGYGTASISERSKLLNKVSVLIGYNSVQDLLESDGGQGESGVGPKDAMHDFDVSLSCGRFSSIVLDSSSPIFLYDEIEGQPKEKNLLLDQNWHEYLPTSVDDKMPEAVRLSENWPSVDSVVDVVKSPLEETTSNVLPPPREFLASEIEVNSTPKATADDTSLSLVSEPLLNIASRELVLDKPLNSIPGISSKHCQQLEKYGFYTLRKLLHHFPRTYVDFQNAQGEVRDGQYLIFVGKILSSRAVRARSSFSFLEVIVSCDIAQDVSNSEDRDTGADKKIYLHLKKFFSGIRFSNQYFLKSLQSKYKEGDFVCVSGKVKALTKKDHFEMNQYDIDVIEDEKGPFHDGSGRTFPLYSSKGGLKPTFLAKTISRALTFLPVEIDPIPEDISDELGLLSLHKAYIGIHQPKTINEADLARKRLIFDEFFYLQLARLFQMLEPLRTGTERDCLLDNYRKQNQNGILIKEWSILTRKLLKALPYALTSSQLNAVSEIIWDLKSPIPMNRLLQGDVGCGKTVVAFLACMEVIGSGYQAAFMVPTELLALQHYEHLLNLLENIEEPCRPSIALLTGSIPTRQSRAIRQGLQSGDISLVIGTHSLIAESIEYSALRIAVIDEQQRFGVMQRGKFNSKLYSSASVRMNKETTDCSFKDEELMAPHVLAMSATPIPRTLAFALYGDMSLTQITELPPGRKPVKTYIFEGNNSGLESVYQMMRDELLSEGKVYIVYPIIEASEQLPQLRAASSDIKIISSKFPGFQCGLLHGKMKSGEKEAALQQFRSGETDILLSTQVIEIGVDVPDASMMVVMNAERFGFSQLHQLRGRVGRGMKESKCMFVVSCGSAPNRLKVLENSSDGFHLAKVDLLLRGPGDLLGKKQSGHIPEFPVARLERDGNILEEAHLAALKVLGTSHDLKRFPMLKAELSMRQPLCLLGD